MLRIWNHPQTHEARLYFTYPVIKKATKAVKGPWRYKDARMWFQSSETGQPEIHTVISGEEGVGGELLDRFQSAAMKEAGLDGGEAWDELVTLAMDDEKKASESDTTSHPTHAESVISAGSEAANKRRLIEASKLDIALIKIPSPITIEIDSRETKLIENLLKAHPQITVTRSSLEVADFRVYDHEGGELLIERKRCTGDGHKTDFETSLQAGARLFDHSERLQFIAANSDHQIIPILILEGNVYGNAGSMLLKQIDGAISYLAAVQRISVLSTYSASHSAYLIAKLASHFVSGRYASRSSGRAKPKGLFAQKRHVLESIPGVSEVLAENLLEKFGSVKGVSIATEEELASVKGVGRKRAKEIVRVLGAF